MIMQKCLFLIAFIIAAPAVLQAQFWHALPPVDSSHTLSACFSNDEKKVFYLTKEGGVANIWGMTVADKYGRIIAGPANPPVQITKFTDRGIVRFFHLLNRPEILFMRLADDGKDYHIYRIKDDGTEMQDLTPGTEGITNEIIGASYNGRFVYYTNNKVNRDKVDVYRYDTQQFSSDMVFPNDKDYKVLAWTRDQNKLLIEDSSTNSLMLYDIETTERTPVSVKTGEKISAVMLDPATLNVQVFDLLHNNQAFPIDFSPNCKYMIDRESEKLVVKDAATNTNLDLKEDYRPLAIAPKETMMVYSLPSTGNASKIFLYDIAKNSSTELATAH